MIEDYQTDGTSLSEEKLSGAKDDIMFMFSVIAESVSTHLKPKASAQSKSKSEERSKEP